MLQRNKKARPLRAEILGNHSPTFADFLFYFLNYNVNSKVDGKRRRRDEGGDGFLVAEISSREEIICIFQNALV